MEELKGLFVGYKTFESKDKTKRYYVISLLFVTENENGTRADYFVKDIFVSPDTYDNFMSRYPFMSSVDVRREIVGDTIRYYI